MQNLYDKDEAEEKLPPIVAYAEKYQSPPVQSARYYLTAVNGNSFNCPPTTGTVIRFEIPAGTYGSHLNTQETALALTITNTTGNTLTLDGSGFALIDRIDVYYGSMQISSIAGYGNLATVMTDFTGGASPHFSKGQDTINAGRVIANTASDTFVLPLINCLGSLALKAIPLSELRDNIRVEVVLNPSMDFGLYGATFTTGVTISSAKLWLTNIMLSGDVHSALVASVNGKLKVPVFDVENYRTSIGVNVGAFTYTIPVKVSSLTSVICTLRESSLFNVFGSRALQRTRSSLSTYQFRIGSQSVPSALIDCSGTATEARMEVQRALNQLNLPVSESYISTALYSLGGATANAANAQGSFAFALNLSAFGAADVLSDGKNIRLESLSVDLKFVGTNVPLQLDVYCLHEKLLCIENSQMTYKN